MTDPYRTPSPPPARTPSITGFRLWWRCRMRGVHVWRDGQRAAYCCGADAWHMCMMPYELDAVFRGEPEVWVDDPCHPFLRVRRVPADCADETLADYAHRQRAYDRRRIADVIG